MENTDNTELKNPFYSLEVDEVLELCGSRNKGLGSWEWKNRLKKQGTNELIIESGVKPWLIFLRQFKSFIIYILFFAVIFSMIIGEYIDSSIILIILIINACIGFFQELSAHRSLEALKKLGSVMATVIRGGERHRIDAKELVVGDIVLLQAGDKIPADGRIMESTRLKMDESILTGESIPAGKTNEVLSGKIQVADQRNMAFSSTSVAAGHGRMVVTATGMQTQIGKITQMVTGSEEEMTPLQRRLSRFGRRLGLVIIAICVVVFILLVFKAYFANGLSDKLFVSFLFIAISLAVAAVPTALPAVVTIALSIGVKRLLAKKALVRQLSSVETLGSCDVICTDKTGTLTRNQMTVRNGWTVGSSTKISGIGYEPKGELSDPISPLLFLAGLICNNGGLKMKSDGWHHYGDPTEVALLVSAAKAGVAEKVVRLDELPFSSERKLMSVLVERQDGTRTIFTKGAVDQLLPLCDSVFIGDKKQPLTEEQKDLINEKNEQYGSRALRVLAFGCRQVDDDTRIEESNLVFIGLQAMIDPPREDVIESLARTQEAGIRVIMMTGDYRSTAMAIGKEVGITGGVCSGEEIDRMDEVELDSTLADGANLFARVTPGHKQRIVTLLQNQGYTVAMTGDGVNDGPALKQANIGIAVGSGTEVAKEASDFVLLDDSFSHIVNAIEEGRGIYDNIQKSIMLLLSGNLGEVLIIFLAVLFGWNLPLTAILLLWINMVTDGAPALAFSLDPYGRDIMRRQPKRKDENILPGPKLALIGVLGTVGTFFALAIFSYFGGSGEDKGNLLVAQTMVFNFVILYEMVLVFVIRRSFQVDLTANKWIWAAVIFSVSLQLLLMYTPLHSVFKIVALSWPHIGVLLVATVLFWMTTRLYQYIIERG